MYFKFIKILSEFEVLMNKLFREIIVKNIIAERFSQIWKLFFLPQFVAESSPLTNFYVNLKVFTAKCFRLIGNLEWFPTIYWI